MLRGSGGSLTFDISAVFRGLEGRLQRRRAGGRDRREV